MSSLSIQIKQYISIEKLTTFEQRLPMPMESLVILRSQIAPEGLNKKIEK